MAAPGNAIYEALQLQNSIIEHYRILYSRIFLDSQVAQKSARAQVKLGHIRGPQPGTQMQCSHTSQGDDEHDNVKAC